MSAETKTRNQDGGRRASLIVVILSIAAAGLTFLFKLYEFVAASTTGIVPGIVTATVMPYFFISAGFLTLAAWAWIGGHYRDVEGPKLDMLHQEEAYDRIEERDEDALFYG